MPTKVTLDFETRSTIDLKKSGAWIYSLGDRTDVLCVCFMEDGDFEVSATRGYGFNENPGRMEILRGLANDDSVLFEAHNASFEYAIWHNIMHKRHGFPDIPIKRWRCSAAAAAYKSMPRALGDLAKAIDAPHKKDEEGKRVMMKMCKPVTEAHRHLHGFWHESEEDWKTLIEYCIDDVKCEHACSSIIGPLPPPELKTWLLDFKINQRGIHVDIPFVKAAHVMKEQIKRRLEVEGRALCGFKPSQVQKLKGWMKERGCVIPTKKNKDGVEKETLGAQVLKKFVADEWTPTDVRKAVRLRQDHSVTSLAKLTAALNYSDSEGVIRGQLLYHGATTGRWAGKGLQPHNLPRGIFNEKTVASDIEECCAAVKRGDLDYIINWFGDIGSAMQVLKSCVRGIVIPRGDRVLRVEDFSQIEARVLPWLAGEQEVLDAFIAGKDLYKFTAAQIYGVLYEEVTKLQRFIGKTASLALGYQGGAGAFTNMALNFGVLIETKQANAIKKDWRDRNKRIVKFWYDLEKAAIRAVQHGTYTRVHGKISFRMQGKYLTMQLPSGRKLWYYKPQVKERFVELGDGKRFPKRGLSHMGSDSARNIKWGRIHTYGGKLAENATQAVARDVLVEAMHRIDPFYPIVLHVHDELVSEVEPARGSLEDMRTRMVVLPEWAKGLPVEADGFETRRYYKG